MYGRAVGEVGGILSLRSRMTGKGANDKREKRATGEGILSGVNALQNDRGEGE